MTTPTKFYVRIAETYPPQYELTDVEPPAERFGGRGRRFTPVTGEPIVHSKMHGGSDAKLRPFVVRGVHPSGELLVQTLEATEHDKLDAWHDIECGDTREGYRFKRYVLKPLTVLIKYGINAAKERARTTTQRKRDLLRDEKVGVCSVCCGDYVASPAKVVHHGYERPGIGYIVGDCQGVNHPPYEVSCDGTKAYRKLLTAYLADNAAQLAALPARDQVTVATGRTIPPKYRLPEYKTLNRGEVGFDDAIANIRRGLVATADKLAREITRADKLIADWKPAKFPRVDAKVKAS